MPAMIWGRAVESRTCDRRIVMQRTHLKELSRVVLSIYKITLKLKKSEHNSLLRQNNIRDIITNHKETRMVKDGDDWHRLQTTNLKKLGLTFQQSANAVAANCFTASSRKKFSYLRSISYHGGLFLRFWYYIKTVVIDVFIILNTCLQTTHALITY